MMITDLPSWCRLVRADNAGAMTLDGTNTYVLDTAAGNVVVDPGPLLEPHLRTVAGLGPVALTVLTHHHPDHAGGAVRFRELTGAPVVARVPGLCIDAEPLTEDGARLDIADLDVRVVHTPGHTADSVSLTASQGGTNVLLTGDTVLGRGTSIVAHPDGNLGEYLASLDRLRSITGPGWVLAPGHGPVRTDAGAVVDDYLAHRRLRLGQVRAAVAEGASTPAEIVAIVYADVDRAVWPAAEATVRAQLEYLQQQPS